ncbi:hypothetical protein PAHAL_8G096600 [Panicum hallii]|jgi:hypothetical protein|uniref:Uncharacterized protein n=1 Tax=Panicum hallii TaxID=206008 RepID=A0A2T8I8C7_9POAL|nr:hypothetical protein PAHAL_8G096600 [Panicum hallii]
MIGSSTDIKRGCDEDPTFDMDVDGNLELEIVGQDEPDARLDLNMQGQVHVRGISQFHERWERRPTFWPWWTGSSRVHLTVANLSKFDMC